MYEDLIEKAKAKNSAESVHQLERMEEQFCFPSFDDENLLQIGRMLVEKSSEYGDKIAVMIQRESDRLTAFQYVSGGCSEKNLHYAGLKLNAARKTRHNSLWALCAKSVGHEVAEIFDEGSDSLPVGGAWPIMVGDEIAAVIALSGLPDGNDFRLLVDVLSAFFGCIPEKFEGMVV